MRNLRDHQQVHLVHQHQGHLFDLSSLLGRVRLGILSVLQVQEIPEVRDHPEKEKQTTVAMVSDNHCENFKGGLSPDCRLSMYETRPTESGFGPMDHDHTHVAKQ